MNFRLTHQGVELYRLTTLEEEDIPGESQAIWTPVNRSGAMSELPANWN